MNANLPRRPRVRFGSLTAKVGRGPMLTFPVPKIYKYIASATSPSAKAQIFRHANLTFPSIMYGVYVQSRPRKSETMEICSVHTNNMASGVKIYTRKKNQESRLGSWEDQTKAQEYKIYGFVESSYQNNVKNMSYRHACHCPLHLNKSVLCKFMVAALNGSVLLVPPTFLHTNDTTAATLAVMYIFLMMRRKRNINWSYRAGSQVGGSSCLFFW
jgi:hypothetical protein